MQLLSMKLTTIMQPPFIQHLSLSIHASSPIFRPLLPPPPPVTAVDPQWQCSDLHICLAIYLRIQMQLQTTFHSAVQWVGLYMFVGSSSSLRSDGGWWMAGPLALGRNGCP